MADPGGDNGGASELLAKFLDLQERIDAAKLKVQKMVEYLGREGLEDHLKEAADDSRMELVEFEQRFQDFVDQSIPHGVPNLDPSLLETFRQTIQEFALEFDVIDVRVSENLLELEDVQATGMVEEQYRSKGLQPSPLAGRRTPGDLALDALLQAGIKVMEHFDPIKFNEEMEEISREFALDILKSRELQAQANKHGKHPSPQKKRKRKLGPADLVNLKKIKSFHRELSGADRRLSDIIVDLYGFPSDEAQGMSMGVVRSTLNGNPETTDPSSSTGSMKLNWDGVKKKRRELQMLKSLENELHVMTPVALRNWIYCLETQMYNLVRHLLSLMSGYEPAMERIGQLRTSLGELRQENYGMVPMVVQRIHAMLERQAPVESALDRDQQGMLYRDMGFDYVIDSIHRMMLNLRFVLMVSGISIARGIPPYVLDMCERVLREAEEELERIQKMIVEGRSNVEKIRKRFDGAGGSGSGSGSGGGGDGSGSGGGSSGMSEKARGKMVMREW
ncbi:hypothetical protein SLA2020_396870 [Shorea laevis]